MLQKPKTIKRQRKTGSSQSPSHREQLDRFLLRAMLGVTLALILPYLLAGVFGFLLDTLDKILVQYPDLALAMKIAGVILLMIAARWLWLNLRRIYLDLREWSLQPGELRQAQFSEWGSSAASKVFNRSYLLTAYFVNRLLAGNVFAWTVLVITLTLLPINPLSPITNALDDLFGTPSDIFPRSSTSSTLAPLFTEEVDYWGGTIQDWAMEYNLDPNLLATIMQIESCGYRYAHSHAGASGLFQVMPFHFERGENHFDPDTNARRGAQVISDCLTRASGDAGLALACYNGGPSVLYRDFDTWAAETQRYYVWGRGIYNDAQRGKQYSETLEEWLDVGGSGLCRAAADVQ